MAFSEQRFNTEIRYGSVGGPEFNTDVLVVNSGHEQRNANWLDARGRWTSGADLFTRAEIDPLVSFFRARMGKKDGFRFKDWTDFKVAVASGVLGAADGNKWYDLSKDYVSGADTHTRRIAKPVTGTVAVYLAAVADVTATWDYVNGRVQLTALSSSVVTGVTKANPAVVTTSGSHGFSNGDTIWLETLAGITQLNDRVYTIGGVGASTFQLTGVDTRTGLITAITKAASAVITTSNTHGFSNGQSVTFSGILGMTELNNLVGTVSGVTGTSFTVSIDSTLFSTYVSVGYAYSLPASGGGVYTAYTSGGSAKKFPQSGAVTWSGDFDVPARFDTDKFEAEFMAYRESDEEMLFQVNGLTIVELRI